MDNIIFKATEAIKLLKDCGFTAERFDEKLVLTLDLNSPNEKVDKFLDAFRTMTEEQMAELAKTMGK